MSFVNVQASPKHSRDPELAALAERRGAEFEAAVERCTAAVVYTYEFPFVRNLPYEEWGQVPELYRSTGEY